MSNTDRRESDIRMGALVSDVAELKHQMARNTEITEQVRDVLASFRVMASVAKWLAAIAAGVTALWHGADSAKVFLNHK